MLGRAYRNGDDATRQVPMTKRTYARDEASGVVESESMANSIHVAEGAARST